MRTNTYIFQFLKNYQGPKELAIDMTMGNGNDTLFLCQHYQKVMAFDINEEALINTEKRLNANGVKAELIKDNHVNLDKYLKTKADLFIFNLGYLPGSEDKRVTKAKETLVAFKKAYELLSAEGLIIITFYKGHEGGMEEYELLKTYFEKEQIRIVENYRSYNHDLEPEVYIIGR